MSGYLTAIDKQPGMHPVRVGETLRRLFAKIVLRLTGPEYTMVCQYDQICAGRKTGIDGAVHEVQYICDQNLTMEDWEFLLIDAKNAFNDINQIRMLWTV